MSLKFQKPRCKQSPCIYYYERNDKCKKQNEIKFGVLGTTNVIDKTNFYLIQINSKKKKKNQ